MANAKASLLSQVIIYFLFDFFVFTIIIIIIFIIFIIIISINIHFDPLGRHIFTKVYIRSGLDLAFYIAGENLEHPSLPVLEIPTFLKK